MVQLPVEGDERDPGHFREFPLRHSGSLRGVTDNVRDAAANFDWCRHANHFSIHLEHVQVHFCIYLALISSRSDAILFRMEQSQMERWSLATAETLRAERGIAQQSQAETARRSGITRTSYRLYEEGQRSPTTLQLATLAEVFGIPFSRLLGEIERRAKEG